MFAFLLWLARSALHKELSTLEFNVGVNVELLFNSKFGLKVILKSLYYLIF